MRPLLLVVLLLTTLLTLWCAALYVSAPAQQMETRAELAQSQSTRKPITDADITVHLSRLERQRQHWGIAAALAGASAIGVLAALLLVGKRRPA